MCDVMYVYPRYSGLLALLNVFGLLLALRGCTGECAFAIMIFCVNI